MEMLIELALMIAGYTFLFGLSMMMIMVSLFYIYDLIIKCKNKLREGVFYRL